ncbi:nucleotide-binding protein [Desulfovibrio sp. TomC]|uniref:nucleotide-binding protein n=1 Tax=Desulfovibrio sp. TomC TaxID=1562888 RepID=UPI000573B98D|nr:hypothetical protein [Desulfovibrio sp. TomC]KHK01250.1 CO dehydrogenase maturation factor [Desulfovibrio sp. TomC]
MRRAIFILSQKGGSGKSTFSRALLDHLRRVRGLPVAAYDADGQVGQLLQHYGARDARGGLLAPQDPLFGVASFDLRQAAQRGMVLDALDVPAPILLFDFPAGCLGDLGRVVGGGRGMAPLLDAFEAEGVRLTVVVVISNVQASTHNVLAAMEAFGDRVDYVVVKNCFYGQPEDFLFFDGFTGADGLAYGGQAREALARRGGVVFALPALPGREYALCDLYSLGFTEAASYRALRRSERATLAVFMQDFGQEADRTAPLFGDVPDRPVAGSPRVETRP